MTRSERSVTKLALADARPIAHDEGMTKLQFNSPKQKLTLPLILLGTSLILSACGGGGTVIVDPPPPAPGSLIAGTVSPWTQGQTSKIAATSIPEISTTVKGTGDFDLLLPSSVMAGDLTDGSELANSCKVTTVTSGLKFAQVVDLAVGTKNPTYYTYSDYTNNVLSYKGWWYSNIDGTVKADKADCGVSLFIGTLNADLTLKKGWNVVNYVQDYNNFVVTLSTAEQTNDRMTWKANPVVSTQALHNHAANPWGLLSR